MEGKLGQFYRCLGYLRMRPCLDRLCTRFGAGSSTASRPIRSWNRGGGLHSAVSKSKCHPRIEAGYSCRWRKYSEQLMSPLGCIHWQCKFQYPSCQQIRSSLQEMYQLVEEFGRPGPKLRVGKIALWSKFLFEMEQQRFTRMRMDILPIRIQESFRHILQ